MLFADSRPTLFTSESVTEGHPDKVADRLSDTVLDAHLARDPAARVACEVLVTRQHVVVAGEIRSGVTLDLEPLVRETIREIGYDRSGEGFDADHCEIELRLERQSGDIARGVDSGGAGDQGLMFGYACDETPELMPLPIVLAHRLTRRLAAVRRDGTLPWLRPDGKAQVTVAYRDGRPEAVTAVVVSCQHLEEIDESSVASAVREHVVASSIPTGLLAPDAVLHVNPTGRFVAGGPSADCGLTGRKIIVDTYGGAAPHGGGAFSGKDPTKVDRSAAYMARHVAKSLVAAGLAKQALVQLAYAIGIAEPVSVSVFTGASGAVPDDELARLVRASFALTPGGIIEGLELRRPIYRTTSSYGHFGRSEPGFTWEATKDLGAVSAARVPA